MLKVSVELLLFRTLDYFPINNDGLSCGHARLADLLLKEVLLGLDVLRLLCYLTFIKLEGGLEAEAWGQVERFEQEDEKSIELDVELF